MRTFVIRFKDFPDAEVKCTGWKFVKDRFYAYEGGWLNKRKICMFDANYIIGVIGK